MLKEHRKRKVYILRQVEQHVLEQQENPTHEVLYGRFQSLTVNDLDEYSPDFLLITPCLRCV